MITPPPIVSGAPPVSARPGGVTSPNSGEVATPRAAPVQPAKHVEPMRYFGGIEGMNAANLIVALQANGTVSGGYSAKAIEAGGTPPPAIVDQGA